MATKSTKPDQRVKSSFDPDNLVNLVRTIFYAFHSRIRVRPGFQGGFNRLNRLGKVALDCTPPIISSTVRARTAGQSYLALYLYNRT